MEHQLHQDASNMNATEIVQEPAQKLVILAYVGHVITPIQEASLTVRRYSSQLK